MSLRKLSYFILILILLAKITYAEEEYGSGKSTLLIKSTTTYNGTKIQYPNVKKPEVTCLIKELPVGGTTGWHKHLYPCYAYVQEGTLTIFQENGKKEVFHQGEAILENVNVFHEGVNTGKIPVKILVFFTGEVDKPNVIQR